MALPVRRTLDQHRIIVISAPRACSTTFRSAPTMPSCLPPKYAAWLTGQCVQAGDEFGRQATDLHLVASSTFFAPIDLAQFKNKLSLI